VSLNTSSIFKSSPICPNISDASLRYFNASSSLPGLFELRLQLHKFVLYLLTVNRVNNPKGLIHEKDMRISCQHPCDPHPLLQSLSHLASWLRLSRPGCIRLGPNKCQLAKICPGNSTEYQITRACGNVPCSWSFLTMKWDLSFLSRHWLGAVGYPSRRAGRGKPRL
jgi:hypothetical protein